MPAGYQIVQTHAIIPGRPGVRVELLEDARLSPELREEWIDEGIIRTEMPDDPALAALCASVAKDPLRGARLRLVSETKGILDERVFERERAELAVADLYGPKRFVLSVTVDYSIGWGSYAGPLTLFVEPSSRKLRWLTAHDPTTGTSKEMGFASTLKSYWRTARVPGGRDILSVRCRPDFDHASPDGELPFLVIYERYHFDGSRWVVTRRTEPGFMEFEGGDGGIAERFFPKWKPSRRRAKR